MNYWLRTYDPNGQMVSISGPSSKYQPTYTRATDHVKRGYKCEVFTWTPGEPIPRPFLNFSTDATLAICHGKG